MTATIPPLYLLLSEITHGVLEPGLIIANNDSPHHYQLTPKAAQLLQNSDVLFYISEEFEVFAKKKLCKKSIELLPLMPTVRNIQNHRQDAHIWLDPDNVQRIVEVMASELSTVDVNNKMIYWGNANALIMRIHACKKEIQTLLVKVNKSELKPYFVTHDAYEYFANIFHIPSAMKFVHNEQHMISIKAMNDLQTMASKGLACIILDPNHVFNLPSEILESTKLVTIDPLSAMENDTYVDFLYRIADGFLECFN